MPLIKTKRKEFIIYKPEWVRTLKKANKLVGIWLSCWLAFDCIFGKRRREICRLKRNDIWIENNFLYVRFYVGKKKKRRGIIDQLPYTKYKTLDHYAMPYILYYLKKYDEAIGLKDGYIFPANTKATTHTVNTSFINGKGEVETREYTYNYAGGYRNPNTMHYYIKKVNKDIWCHLARHSVATKSAEKGSSEYDISKILDVTPRTASKYVHHGTGYTKKWASETD